MYALAATAAGVGLSVLALPSAAEIVYTPANTSIGPGEIVPLDLNHDGTVDFNFKVATSQRSFAAIYYLAVVPAQPGNNIWGHSSNTGRGWASALPPGFLVGPRGQFYLDHGKQMAATSVDTGKPGPGFYAGSCVSGGWGGVKGRYLALKFNINGETHFGWARLNVACAIPKVTATLTGYAYETVPNRPTVTGLERYEDSTGDSTLTLEPATLGRLAQGTSGLAAWRKASVAVGEDRSVR
jgi:hypothetical protein